MKEENKKVTRKNTPKKTGTKKVSKKAKSNELNLNETVNLDNVKKQEVVINESSYVECKYCHKPFEKGYTICPNCHKRQGSSVGLTFFIVFAIVFLFAIIFFHFTEKYIINGVKEDYKDTCILVDYENLVRHPKDYKGKDIKVIGEVVSVEGTDSGFSNDMLITINANLFENGTEQLITIVYSDKTYNQGFIKGDTLTVYGNYDSINGNIPNIDAKFVVFGK